MHKSILKGMQVMKYHQREIIFVNTDYMVQYVLNTITFTFNS